MAFLAFAIPAVVKTAILPALGKAALTVAVAGGTAFVTNLAKNAAAKPEDLEVFYLKEIIKTKVKNGLQKEAKNDENLVADTAG